MILASKTRARLDLRLRALGIESLWQQGIDGRGVGVGHVDTGVSGIHPALAASLQGWVYCHDDGSTTETLMAVDHDGHGTHTAGLICGGRLDGRSIGIAPAARLYSAAALEDGQSLIRVLGALRWLCAQDIRVCCLPLGISCFNPVWWTALACLRRRDISTVCAVGNVGPGRACAPANYGHILSVGASEMDRKSPPISWRALDSSGRMSAERYTDTVPKLLAPGESLWSAGCHACPGVAVRQSGSSQACALVAGVIALLRQACPRATAYQVESALCVSATRVRDDREILRDGSLFGMIDPQGALRRLRRARSSLPRHRRVPRRAPFFRDSRLGQDESATPCILVSGQAHSTKARAFLQYVERKLSASGQPSALLSSWPEAGIVWGRLSHVQRSLLWGDDEIAVISGGTADYDARALVFERR